LINKLPLSDQWARLHRPIEMAINRAREINRLHIAAAQKFTAAEYTFSKLMIELSAVMPLGDRIERKAK